MLKKVIISICLLFSLSSLSQNNYEYSAVVISVYDADTITVILNLGFNVSITEKIRLNRINAPELRGEERPMGLISRDKLRERILGKSVVIKTFKDKKGKYGRYIGEVILDGENMNDWLVKKRLAVYKYY